MQSCLCIDPYSSESTTCLSQCNGMVIGLIGMSFLIALLGGVFLLGIHFGNNSSRFVVNYSSKDHSVRVLPSGLISTGNETYTATKSPFSLPSAPKPFVGRENEIKEIISELMSPIIFTIGLFGPPAYGKSSLAVHVGHRMLKQRIPVNYFDLNELTITFEPSLTEDDYHSNQGSNANVQPFVRRSLSTGRAYQKTVNSHHLLQWAKNITRPSILILDNCDSVYNKWQEEFQEFVMDLIEESSQQLTILITSQVEILFVENFGVHKISELSQEASYTLISQLYPPIELVAQAELAKLVGNCPLAIKVILNLLKLPESVSPAELIEQLRQNPIKVLSARRLPKKLNFTAVMTTATKYLSLTLKETAFFLSLFPGSFEGGILQVPRDLTDDIEELEIRSLVESYYVASGTKKRYKLHELIKRYFAQAFQDLVRQNYLLHKFNKQFRFHYTHLFSNYIQSLNFSSLVLDHQDSFYREQHNLKHLLSMIIPAACIELNIEEITIVLFAHKMRLINKDEYKDFSCILQSFSQKGTIVNICKKYSQTTCSSLLVDVFQTHLRPGIDIQFDDHMLPTPCWILHQVNWDRILKSFDSDYHNDIASSLSSLSRFCSDRKHFMIVTSTISLPFPWFVAYEFAYYFTRTFDKAHPKLQWYQWSICILLCICSILAHTNNAYEYYFYYVSTSDVQLFLSQLLGAVLISHFLSLKVILMLGFIVASSPIAHSTLAKFGFSNLTCIALHLVYMMAILLVSVNRYLPITISNRKSFVMTLYLLILHIHQHFLTFVFALYINTGVQDRIIRLIIYHDQTDDDGDLLTVMQILLKFVIAFVLFLVPLLVVFVFVSKRLFRTIHVLNFIL